MKLHKSIYILLVLPLLIISSCDLEEANINPNEATDVSVDILLPAAQANFIYGYAGEMAEYGSILIQQMTGTLSDQQNVANYRFLPEFSDFAWNNRLYAGCMVDFQTIIDKATDNGATHYRGIARIMLATALATVVDIWGDAPFSEAFNLDNTAQPSYDDGATLYQQVQTLLDEGIADLQAESTLSPSNNDFVYPNSSEAGWVATSAPLWIKAARALKARYYNHLSKVDPQGSANAALAAINAGTFDNHEENANMEFGEGFGGPWFLFLTGTFGQNNIALAQTFADRLEDRIAAGEHDPRAQFYFRDNGSGLFNAVPYGATSAPGDAATVGDYLNSIDAPTNIITYTEVKFIEAEANFRLGNFPEAAAAFNEAVKSSILRVTGSPSPEYEAKFASEDAASIQNNGLEKIFTEKHIALFLEFEAWNDWRRSIPAGAAGTVSGIPAITPATSNETNGVFPRRFLYPQGEINNNTNTPEGLTNTDKSILGQII